MKNNLKLIIILIFLILLFSINVSASYFEADDFRKSLLSIRETERYLRRLEENYQLAADDFKIIADSEVELQLEELNDLYQKQLEEYQLKNDLEVEKLALEIKDISELISLQLVESKPVQLRAFWLDSGTFANKKGREGLVEFLDLVEKANFNLIFPEVYFKDLAVIPDNELFKQDPRFENWDEDPLAVLVEEAHKRGIEIHPWVWVFNENTAGQPGRILEKNPEWANISRSGEIVSYHNSSWLSPARKDVREYLQLRYKYLVENYDLDGINLDYIRFPDEYHGSYGYDEASVSRFKSETGIDPFEIERGSSDSAAWNRFRENLITEMVRDTAEILKEVDPDLIISADVIPGRNEARYRALQNWSLWLEEGYLDFAIPMTYTENLFSELNRWIIQDRAEVEKAIYAGVSVFKLSSAQMIRQVEEINRINANGLSLFAAAHLNEADFESLAAGVFKEKAILAHQDKNKALNTMQNFILQRLNIIKAAEEVDNSSLISLRAYLNEIIKANNSNFNFIEYIEDNSLNLSENVKKVLESDFNYLKDIIRLY